MDMNIQIGETMEEAPDKLEFEVTQEDIDNGIQNSCENCAISLAVKKAYSSKFVATDHSVIVYFDENPCLYKLTEEADRFIKSFDHDKKDVKPQKFSLELWYECKIKT